MRIDNSHLSKLELHSSTLAQQAPPAGQQRVGRTAEEGSSVLSPLLSRKVAELRLRLQSLDAGDRDAELSALREKIEQGGLSSVEAARQTAEAVVARWFGTSE